VKTIKSKIVSCNIHSSQCTHVVPFLDFTSEGNFVPQIDLDSRWNTCATSKLKSKARFKKVNLSLCRPEKHTEEVNVYFRSLLISTLDEGELSGHFHAPPALPQARTH